MKVTNIDNSMDVLLETAPRSQGVHMSDIYNSFYEEAYPSKYDKSIGPNPVKLAMGLAWEQYWEKLLIKNGVDATRPGEFTTPEGIIGSPDLMVINGEGKLGEIKLTYYAESLDLSEPKFGKWLMQVMAYGHYLGINKVRFYVLFVNGQYRRNGNQPTIKTYEIEFTAQELQENWQTLMSHARNKRMI